MSLAEIEKAADELNPDDLAKPTACIARRDNAEWDAAMERDFSEGGRLRSVLEEVRADVQAGRLEEMP